ncbi:DUF1707 domain-containing protein [Nonomuraea thailandensis]
MDRNDLRIGDAEREQTMAALREHFAQGRLTHEELDERLDRSLAAKTARDLAQVTADLPGQEPPTASPPRRTGRATGTRPCTPTGRRCRPCTTRSGRCTASPGWPGGTGAGPVAGRIRSCPCWPRSRWSG